MVIARAGVLLHGQARHFAGIMALEKRMRIAGARGDAKAVNKKLVQILVGEAPV